MCSRKSFKLVWEEPATNNRDKVFIETFSGEEHIQDMKTFRGISIRIIGGFRFWWEA